MRFANSCGSFNSEEARRRFQEGRQLLLPKRTSKQLFSCFLGIEPSKRYVLFLY